MDIKIQEKENQEFRTYLKDKIKAMNNILSPSHLASRQAGYITYIQIQLFEDDTCIGGLTGRMYWSCLEIDDFFIESSYRRLGYGTKVMKKVIAYAKEKSLAFILLKTFSFQAKPFYETLGFHVIGEIKNYPDTFSLYTLRYDLL